MPNDSEPRLDDEAAIVGSGRFVTGHCHHITWWAAATVDLPDGGLTVTCPECGPVQLQAPQSVQA